MTCATRPRQLCGYVPPQPCPYPPYSKCVPINCDTLSDSRRVMRVAVTWEALIAASAVLMCIVLHRLNYNFANWVPWLASFQWRPLSLFSKTAPVLMCGFAIVILWPIIGSIIMAIKVREVMTEWGRVGLCPAGSSSTVYVPSQVMNDHYESGAPTLVAMAIVAVNTTVVAYVLAFSQWKVRMLRATNSCKQAVPQAHSRTVTCQANGWALSPIVRFLMAYATLAFMAVFVAFYVAVFRNFPLVVQDTSIITVGLTLNLLPLIFITYDSAAGCTRSLPPRIGLVARLAWR